MKIIGGILLILAGLAFGAYVGIYLFLVGGIVEFIHGVSASPVSAHEIAWGVVRVLLTAAAGTLSFLLGFIPGMALIRAAAFDL